ncbi:MAG: radical SAM protein [Treponema sp.]|nr:radical SAM protein [Treponema sp.]
MEQLYKSCRQCPRNCGADRASGKKGACGESAGLRAASACLHFGEEPLLTVFGGSGTIFFTGCTLRCAFCQNYQISQQGMGREISTDEFVTICLKLQDAGAENINLVTGSHHIPVIARGIRAAKDAGLKIPVAWNSSGYESSDMLDMLGGLVDIWLPDLKTLNPMMSESLFGAADYPAASKKAVRKMLSLSPLRIQEVKKGGEVREKILSGVIVRHLFLPGRMDDTVMVLDYLKSRVDGKACISLMSQYTPVPFEGEALELERRNKSLAAFQNRLVSPDEDTKLREMIDSYCFEYLFYQDLSDDTSWLPDFRRPQPFSSVLAKPVWHWKFLFADG